MTFRVNYRWIDIPADIDLEFGGADCALPHYVRFVDQYICACQRSLDNCSVCNPAIESAVGAVLVQVRHGLLNSGIGYGDGAIPGH